MRLILVPTADRPESALALDVAFDLAANVGANVAGCHVRGERFEPMHREVQLVPEIGYGREAAVASAVKLTSKAAYERFARSARRHGFALAKSARVGQHRRALWHNLVGTPSRAFAIIGPIADLAVLTRPKRSSRGVAQAFLLAALLHSARPVLVLPQKPLGSIGKRILVAWDQSAEATLAVAAAIPLMQKAEQVIVMSSGPENRAGPKSTHLAQYLANWDVKVQRQRTAGRDVEKEIEGLFRETRSDLLTMGAYSRSRLRQLLFGGVTEHMLFRTDIPALMLHR